MQLPADALLGTPGRGFHMMMSVLEKGRIGIASLAVGIVQAALEASVEQAKIRKQFGQQIADFQAIQFMLADMAKDSEAASLLVRSAAMKIDAGIDATAGQVFREGLQLIEVPPGVDLVKDVLKPWRLKLRGTHRWSRLEVRRRLPSTPVNQHRRDDERLFDLSNRLQTKNFPTSLFEHVPEQPTSKVNHV